MATSIKIDDELKARIQSLAEQRQRSAHWIMRAYSICSEGRGPRELQAGSFSLMVCLSGNG